MTGAEPEGLAPVPLPRRLDRRLRLGPFPSAREAMRFAGYAAAGAVLLPIGGPIAWLPVLGAGFLFAVVRPDGKGLDDRVADYVRWQWRHRSSPDRPRRSPSPGAVLRLPGGFAATILESSGVPTRFLPPPDARALFDRYRALVRSVEPGLLIEVDSAPIARRPARNPASTAATRREAEAFAGYQTLAGLLIRRRRFRRVRVALFGRVGSDGGIDALQARTRTFAASLAALGVRARPLTGPELDRAAGAFGWARSVGA